MIQSEFFTSAVIVIEFRANGSIGRKVHPGKRLVERQDLVQWRNYTNEKICLTFPEYTRVFEEFPAGGVVHFNPHQGLTYTVKIDAEHGEYPYRVQNEETGEYYQGDSDPRIDVL
jgi:hypothetical protein